MKILEFKKPNSLTDNEVSEMLGDGNLESKIVARLKYEVDVRRIDAGSSSQDAVMRQLENRQKL